MGFLKGLTQGLLKWGLARAYYQDCLHGPNAQLYEFVAFKLRKQGGLGGWGGVWLGGGGGPLASLI